MCCRIILSKYQAAPLARRQRQASGLRPSLAHAGPHPLIPLIYQAHGVRRSVRYAAVSHRPVVPRPVVGSKPPSGIDWRRLSPAWPGTGSQGTGANQGVRSGVNLLRRKPKVTRWRVMPGTSSCGTLVVCGRFRVGGKMARSGQGTGEPPQAVVAEGSGSLAPRPRPSGLDTKVTWGLVGLGLVGHMLRSPRFYEMVAVAAIAVASLRQIGQQNRASTTARLAAWNKREMQRLERKAQRQTRTVKGAAQMARSGRPRGLAGSGHET